jgi:radical SAM superfamily enzyme YgiQ (UPF0313 family)
MPRLLLINPINPVNIFSFLKSKFGKNNGVVFVPPIGLGYIAAVTPESWQIKILDEAVDPFEFETADLVGITATTGQAPRAYEIADIYRRKKIPVVMGGIHVSFRPEEALSHADSVVIGEAEDIWSRVIEDFTGNKLKQVYRGSAADLGKAVVPRRQLFSRKYRIGSIMTSRGCPFSCDFCTVTIFNGSKLRRRSIQHVIGELKTIPQKYLLFLDDNLLGYTKEHKTQVKNLFSEMIKQPIRKKWVAQTSINSLADRSVLELARKAGCIGFFVGMESVNEEVLKTMNKSANLKTGIGSYIKNIREIHKHGMIVMGNFVLGYERGLEELRWDTQWMKKSPLDIVNFAILTPYPGTKIFDRLNEGKKIIKNNFPDDWGFYDADHPVSQMSYLKPGEIHKGIQERFLCLYSYSAIIIRFFRTFIATHSLLPSIVALLVNVLWVRNKNRARLIILKSFLEKQDRDSRYMH